MPDLNKMMSDVQKQSVSVERQIRGLMEQYENLCREGMQLFREERISSGSMDGLEEFYKLVQIMKRNRDVVGSLLRGFGNLRSIDKFKFVEMDVPESKEEEKKKKGKKINKKKIEELRITAESDAAELPNSPPEEKPEQVDA